MNRLLLDAGEVDGAWRATVRGRRARHLCGVLRVAPGSVVRAGVLDGPRGLATVAHVGVDEVEVRCAFDEPAGRRSQDMLVLAVPRPAVLARVLEDAASLGFGRIVLIRSWRTDKSHLRSRVLAPAALREHLVLGLEQSGGTCVPEVVRADRFKPFVEDELERVVPAGARFVMDPSATATVADARATAHAAFAIAIGPERGFTPYEVGMLAERGFAPVRLGDGVLRVEAAVIAAHAQLALVRELAARGAQQPTTPR